jgi:hypothetical protein
MKQEFGLSYLFIGDDLVIVEQTDVPAGFYVHPSSVREFAAAWPRRATTTERPVWQARHPAVRIAGRASNARSRSTGSCVNVTSFSISTPQPMQKN